MKRSRFTEEQIIAILKEQENGLPTRPSGNNSAQKLSTFGTSNEQLSSTSLFLIGN